MVWAPAVETSNAVNNAQAATLMNADFRMCSPPRDLMGASFARLARRLPSLSVPDNYSLGDWGRAVSSADFTEGSGKPAGPAGAVRGDVRIRQGSGFRILGRRAEKGFSAQRYGAICPQHHDTREHVRKRPAEGAGRCVVLSDGRDGARPLQSGG